MLQQKERKSKVRIDKAVLSDATQLGNSLGDLAKKQGTPRRLQKLASKKMDFSGKAVVETAVVFLTDKKQTSAHKKVLKWIGIDNELGDDEVFKGKTNGILRFANNNSFRMHLFHFEHYPIQKLSDCKKALKIIIYDRSYRRRYGNWDLALHVLGVDPSVVMMIDITNDLVPRKTVEVPRIKALSISYYKIGDLGNSAEEILTNEDLGTWLQVSRLMNYLDYTSQVLQLLESAIDRREKELRGKSILLNKKQLQSDQQHAEVSTREIGFLKAKVDSGHKQIGRLVEERIENFEKEDCGYRELQEEITSFLGFVEQKQSRYVTLAISDGAIRDKIGKSHNVLTGFFDGLGQEVNAKAQEVDADVFGRFNEWGIAAPKIGSVDFGREFTSEILNGSTKELPDKPLEKKITSKGFGSLLMELRTPLFMLMPFMMIFALFAALVGGEDKGNIDESVLFHENRPTIAIDKLPEARNNEFRRFIKEVEENRDPRKGVFDKEINGELVTEPQLATITIESPQSYGGKVKIEETVDYHFDSKNQIIYLYLTENSDRNFVIQKLYDPANALLSIPSSTRRGFGIGGLIRALSGLRDYRYLLLIGLVSLVSWFIISRKRGMDRELKSAKNKEQHKLNHDLKQYVDKSIRQNLVKWRTRLADVLGEKQNRLIKAIEKAVNNNVEQRRLEKLQERKILQKKMEVMKTEKTKWATLKTEYKKLASKQEQLQLKLNRMAKA